jgi:hypothetical protein
MMWWIAGKLVVLGLFLALFLYRVVLCDHPNGLEFVRNFSAEESRGGQLVGSWWFCHRCKRSFQRIGITAGL